jgi:hypothetical protein
VATVNGSEAGLHDGLDQLLVDYENLQRRLQTMPVIEQAKGLLIGRFGIEPEAAFALLRRWSSHTNVKLRDLSRLLVDTAAEPVEPHDAAGPRQTRDALDHLIASLNTGARTNQQRHIPETRTTSVTAQETPPTIGPADTTQDAG